MTRESPPGVSRLARANPSPVDGERGQSPEAQAILSQILAGERSLAPARASGQPRASGEPLVSGEPRAPRAPRAPRRPSRRLVLVMAVVLLLGAGAAVAATDPFGFWRSSSPGTAMFAVDPGRHVRTPTAQAIACPSTSGGYFRCGPHLQGQRYLFNDRIQAVNLTPFSRATLQRALAHSLAGGRVSQASARRIDADFAQVSDSFFTHLNFLMRFTTFGSSFVSNAREQLVPPSGVPPILVCESAGNALDCRDLNGDESAAIGSGIYVAVPARDWVRTRPQQPVYEGERLIEQVFGRPLTADENRVLRDLLATATTQTSSSSSSPSRVAPAAPPRAGRK